MLSNKKKFAVGFTMAPTIMSIDSSDLSESAQKGVDSVDELFQEMIGSLSKKLDEVTNVNVALSKDGSVTVDRTEELEFAKAKAYLTGAKTQILNIIIGAYNTLSKLAESSKLESKVDTGFDGIITKSVRVAKDIVDFMTSEIGDYADGIENIDDKTEFAGLLVTKLYIYIAKVVTFISDVCYDTERMANKLLNGGA